MKKYKFLLFAVILIIVKQLLVVNIPIFAIGDSTCDDQLMIKLETSLLQLDWLGPFNSLTFVKGMFFPLFLAINAFLGISYINGTTLIYSISCLIFSFSIKDLFKNKYPIYIIFTLLLFNPIMYSLEVVGRVYRNSLTPAQTLLIFSSIIALFTNRKNNKKINWFWSILGGLSLASFFNTREDAIWIIPMVAVFTLIMLGEHIIKSKKYFEIKKIIQFILPLFILIICNFSISMINYKRYGVFTRVDVSGTSFSNAINAIYSVPPVDNIEYVSVTREKLERIYKISPSLNVISKDINEIAIEIDKNGRNPNDNEIEDGWFWWVLRFAAEKNGYYENAKKANEYFNQIAKEISEAQNNGLIEKQKTMPSALMSPWRKGYSKKLIDATLKIIYYTNSYKDVQASAVQSVGSYNTIKLFEIATNDRAIIPNIYNKINGWYVYNQSDYYIDIINGEKNIQKINCKQNITCNIDINLDGINLENILIDVHDINGVPIEKLYLSDKLTTDSNELRTYNFYEYSLTNSADYQQKVSNIYVSRLNKIGSIYRFTGVICGIIGLICYLIITFIVLFKNRCLIDKWLIVSSVLASYLVLCVGVAYNEISSCPSINTLYLCGTYVLIIIFWTMSVFTLIENVKINKKKDTNSKNKNL